MRGHGNPDGNQSSAATNSNGEMHLEVEFGGFGAHVAKISDCLRLFREIR